MPRYFFHLADGRREEDTEGTELPDLSLARREAVLFLAQTIKDDPSFVWGHNEFSIQVTDENGKVVATVTAFAI